MDDLLGFYIQHAREEDILVDANIQPIHKNLGFDIIDLTVLIGNIMENAMDACRLVSQKPYIRIWLRLSESALLMKIENSCLTDGTQIRTIPTAESFSLPNTLPCTDRD